jgi:hypothetical protein
MCKISSKKPKGYYKHQLFIAYAFIESQFPRIPKVLVSDNEDALLQLPHPNKAPGPIHYPQGQGMVERLHKELDKLSRIHKTTPDRAVAIYNTNLPLGGEDDGISSMPVAEHSGNVQFASTDYDGRFLKPGDLVHPRVPRRSRKKSDPCWKTDIHRVVERIGRKTYHVYDGDRVTKQNIDNLKDFSLAEDLIKNLKINPDLLVRAEAHVGSLSDFDEVCDNFSNLDDVVFDNRVMFLGYPGLDQMEKLASIIEAKQCKVLHAIVPELRCMSWYKRIDVNSSIWHGVSPDDDSEITFWTDCCGRKVTLPSITWYITKFT